MKPTMTDKRFTNTVLLTVTLALGGLTMGCNPKLIGSKLGAVAGASSSSSSGGSSSSGFVITSAGLKGFQATGATDLNTDGFFDLVMADTDSSDVVVKTADGAGGWNADVTYSPTGVPIGMTFGDLNKDGRPDLFVTLSTGGVDVLLRGAANFGAAVNYAGGSATAGITAGDFNKDGTVDVVAVDLGGDRVGILLGNAAGSLGAAAFYSVGTAPVGITSADFNHDGNLDIAVTNSGDNNISIRLGDGAGGFGAETTFNVGTLPVGITTGDFNRDGDADLSAANFTSGTVSVLLGNGAGGFGAAASTTVGTGPVNLAAGDLNVDGIPDLVVANYGSNNASKLLGVGNGTFAAAVNTATSTGPLAVVIADFDRSAEPDAAITEQADTTPTLITGTDPAAPGTFSDSANLAMGGGSDPMRVTTGDFDNDGDEDLAALDFTLDKIRIFFNDGAGTLALNQDLALVAGAQATGVAVGDLDRDGDLDMAVSQRAHGYTRVYKNNGAGTFGASFDSIDYNSGGGGGEIWDVAIADVDKDGDLDVIGMGNTFGSDPVADVYSNDGTGDLSLLDTITSPALRQNSRYVNIADLDNDGDIDIVFPVADHNFMAFALNNGSGGFPANPTYVSTGANSNSYGIRFADVNRDGYLDALVSGTAAAKEASIMTNTTAANFNAPVVYNTPGNMTAMDMLPIDVDFDGDFDFFMSHQDGVGMGSTGVELLLGDGSTGMVQSSYVAGTCEYAQYAAMADFNRDGRTDVAVTCMNDDNISIFLAN